MSDRGGELLRQEPNLLEVDAPITGEFCQLYMRMKWRTSDRCLSSATVCGDIHGQYVS